MVEDLELAANSSKRLREKTWAEHSEEDKRLRARTQELASLACLARRSSSLTSVFLSLLEDKVSSLLAIGRL